MEKVERLGRSSGKTTRVTEAVAVEIVEANKIIESCSREELEAAREAAPPDGESTFCVLGHAGERATASVPSYSPVQWLRLAAEVCRLRKEAKEE